MELSPSDFVVHEQISELEQKVRKVAALVAAAAEFASTLPDTGPVVSHLQQLVDMADESLLDVIGRVEWTMKAFLARSAQISPVLKQVA